MGRNRAPLASLALLRRLLGDSSGNTLAMIGAALVPVLAMAGGGIDMGRSYLAQSRLQQACDAGVLAARKKLGTAFVTTGEIPGEVAATGERFFDINFGNESYGTENRRFQMTLEEDYSLTGEASVDVPTTIMGLFGYSNVDIAVKCQAKLNFSKTDIMFVLDTTGSMLYYNSGDSKSRIASLRDVVKDFHKQIEESKAPGARVRYGFVPYSTNVNVGGLLKPDWMVDSWSYQTRELADTGRKISQPVYEESWTYYSGIKTIGSKYDSDICPPDTARSTTLSQWSSNGISYKRISVQGNAYLCEDADNFNYRITPTVYSNYVYDYGQKLTGYKWVPEKTWLYKKVDDVRVSSLKNSGKDLMRVGGRIRFKDAGGAPNNPTDLYGYFNGCVEERDTYEIDDYDDVDFSRALDLDIDLVPSPSNPATQWRPMLNEISYARGYYPNHGGNFWFSQIQYNGEFFNPHSLGYAACPSPAQKLKEMSAAEVDSYMGRLIADGSTYHDIGMIWGARLLAGKGLFASENADAPNQPTSRHLIFLTDGDTYPVSRSYSTYGIEGLDRRRWSPSSSLTLTNVVEQRFGVACAEAKKRNITVWVIGFGVSLNPVMTECAGAGKSFEARNSKELQDIFARIAAQIGELRISA